jgi:hypothetical protein
MEAGVSRHAAPLIGCEAMQLATVAALLLAFVECGQTWKLRHDQGLSVSDFEVGTAAEGSLRYQIGARGLNGCCNVDVDLLNGGPTPVRFNPWAAELTSQSCSVEVGAPYAFKLPIAGHATIAGTFTGPK